MITVLAQERLLGAALGSLVTGAVIFEHRRSINKSVADFQSPSSPQPQLIISLHALGSSTRSSLKRYRALLVDAQVRMMNEEQLSLHREVYSY